MKLLLFIIFTPGLSVFILSIVMSIHTFKKQKYNQFIDMHQAQEDSFYFLKEYGLLVGIAALAVLWSFYFIF